MVEPVVEEDDSHSKTSGEIPTFTIPHALFSATDPYVDTPKDEKVEKSPVKLFCQFNTLATGTREGHDAKRIGMCGFVVPHGVIHLLANKSHQYPKSFSFGEVFAQYSQVRLLHRRKAPRRGGRGRWQEERMVTSVSALSIEELERRTRWPPGKK